MLSFDEVRFLLDQIDNAHTTQQALETTVALQLVRLRERTTVPRSELLAERVHAERLTATIRDLTRANDELRGQIRAIRTQLQAARRELLDEVGRR